MTEVVHFYTLSHIFISLVGAILLLVIYFNIKNRFRQILEEGDAQKRVDKGLLYLSLALFVWVFSGFWAYIGLWFEFYGDFSYEVGVYLFSIFNNMFFLLALFYFNYAPEFIYKNEKNVKLILILIAVVTLSTLVVSKLAGEVNYNQITLTALPDLILSAFLTGLLIVSFYRTFMQRGLKLIAVVSVLVLILMFASQLPSVFQNLNNDFANFLIKIIAKTSLIFLFMVLATSWVIQLANTPTLNEMQIKFEEWAIVVLSIPSKAMNAALLDFGSKATQYKNLFKFAIRRKYGQGEEQSMLIGPTGEVKNQTYLSRIIENINLIRQLKDNQHIERKDLFIFLGEGRYRLRMLPQHIQIDENLLKEFINHPDNKAYLTIVEKKNKN